MLNALLLYTVFVPFALGLIVAATHVSPRPFVQGVAVFVALAAIYLGLEGLPPFPPVASKHKVFYVFLALGGVALLPRLSTPGLIALAALAVLWIGQRRLAGGALPPAFFAVLVPLPAIWFAGRASLDTRFRWPVPVLVWLIGGAVISVDGGYIGSGQMLGALAAFAGGALLMAFGALALQSRHQPGLRAAAGAAIIAAGIAALAGTAFFAPKLNVVALALLNLVLLVPFAAPRLLPLPAVLRPLILGALSAIAVAPAVLVALLF